jgi:hypothetical protein
MPEEMLARDGYSARPALLRALALSLISLILALFNGPRYMVVLLAAAAGLEYLRYAHRRRDALTSPDAR